MRPDIDRIDGCNPAQLVAQRSAQEDAQWGAQWIVGVKNFRCGLSANFLYQHAQRTSDQT